MINDFASLRLPDHMCRDTVLKEKYRPEGYLKALDRDTLWYDAVWSNGCLRLICPPLNNFRSAFRKATFRGDDTPLKFRRLRRYARHEVAELDAPDCPKTLSILMQGWSGKSPVNRATPGLFAGLNTAFVMNKDNLLDWIATHATYHRDAHGLQALIVMDNGSTSYSRIDIERALAPLGLERLLVLDVPFKYGPMGKKPYRRTEKYLQTAMFNVLRLRYLSEARAVLNCDIDEIIVALDGKSSVFDAALASRLGFIQVAGHWAYPEPGTEGPWSHADHSRTMSPPRYSPPKWVIVPAGRLGGYSWDIHGLERLPFLRRRTVKGFGFLHCRNLSIGWKSAKRLDLREDTVPDDMAEIAARFLVASA